MIGGSGLYEMPGLQNTREYNIDTPFGKTSAPIVVGTLEGEQVAFLARHGIGHHITPSEVPYQRKYLCVEITGGATHRQHQRLRITAGRICAWSYCYSRPDLRQHTRTRSFLFWRRSGCACQRGGPLLRGSLRSIGISCPPGRRRSASWRFIDHNRRPALFDEG